MVLLSNLLVRVEPTESSVIKVTLEHSMRRDCLTSSRRQAGSIANMRRLL